MFPGNVVRFDTLSNTYDIQYFDGWEESGVASNHVTARVLPSVQEKRAATIAAKAAATAAKKAAAGEEGTAWHAAPPHRRVRREVCRGVRRKAHRRARGVQWYCGPPWGQQRTGVGLGGCSGHPYSRYS